MIQNVMKYNTIYSNITVRTEIYIGENTKKNTKVETVVRLVTSTKQNPT